MAPCTVLDAEAHCEAKLEGALFQLVCKTPGGLTTLMVTVVQRFTLIYCSLQ